jgi:hypothetical protein
MRGLRRRSVLLPVKDLPEEMQECRSVKACIDFAITDAYGPDEQAVAWLTCIEELFRRHKRVRLMDVEVALVGFDLRDRTVVAICQQGKRRAWVTLDSIVFPDQTPIEARWLRAWKHYSEENG